MFALQPRPAQDRDSDTSAASLRTTFAVLGDRERRRLRFVEDAQIASRAPRPRRSARLAFVVSGERRSTWPRTATTNSERRRLARSSRRARRLRRPPGCGRRDRGRRGTPASRDRARDAPSRAARHSLPTSAARSAPQVCVRARLPSCSAMHQDQDQAQAPDRFLTEARNRSRAASLAVRRSPGS